MESEIAALKDRLAQMEKQAAEISAQKDAEINRLKGTYEDLVKDLKGEAVLIPMDIKDVLKELR